ncbi:hypothetical protein [Sutcliffiella sp. FSL R7-0096]|uniref:hypothetical protein n=1 Tax=Sutcliffiella sp. FSL R7-0096 TaxID=2921670 RepID=UPI00315AC805
MKEKLDYQSLHWDLQQHFMREKYFMISEKAEDTRVFSAFHKNGASNLSPIIISLA